MHSGSSGMFALEIHVGQCFSLASERVSEWWSAGARGGMLDFASVAFPDLRHSTMGIPNAPTSPQLERSFSPDRKHWYFPSGETQRRNLKTHRNRVYLTWPMLCHVYFRSGKTQRWRERNASPQRRSNRIHVSSALWMFWLNVRRT